MNLKANKLRSRIIDMEIIWRVISWKEEGKNGGKGAGIKKYKLAGTE